MAALVQESEVSESSGYLITELSEEVRKGVLDKHRYDFAEGAEWFQSTIEHWNAELEEMGFMEPKIKYSGFCAQGCGACFDCDRIDIRVFVGKHKELFINLFFPDIKPCVDAISNNFSFDIDSNSSRFYHANARYVDWGYDTDVSLVDELGPELASKVTGGLDEIKSSLEDERASFCDKIYKDLESDYLFMISDEFIAETMNINEWRFTMDGERIIRHKEVVNV